MPYHQATRCEQRRRGLRKPWRLQIGGRQLDELGPNTRRAACATDRHIPFLSFFAVFFGIRGLQFPN